jgi:hypothetical protein
MKTSETNPLLPEPNDYKEAAKFIENEFDALGIHSTRMHAGLRVTAKWKHNAWVFTFIKPYCTSFTCEYKTGTGIKEPPEVCRVLANLCREFLDSDCSFPTWCDNFGCDKDSRKAFAIYEACLSTGDDLKKILTYHQIKRFAYLSSQL